ncbi:MAG: response regulator, partial [Gallionellaceae bacterium]
HIAFILLSSESNWQLLDAVRQVGICAILGKPFTAEELKKALDSSLDYLELDNNTLAVHDEVDIESLKVLLVDDSHSVRAFTHGILKKLGFAHVVEAVGGKEAIEIIQEHTFDLVVTDYNMPEINGRELTEFIRTQSWQSTVPILMITSESEPNCLAGLANSGVSGICGKPFEPIFLKNLLEKILRECHAH